MNIIGLWMSQDFVVKTLIIAFFIATIIILEKSYQLLMARRAIKRLETSQEEEGTSIYLDVLRRIRSFESHAPALFNANVGVQLERVDLHLERYVGILGLIAVLSPMLGLIGTFFGVWHVFEGVGNFGLNDAAVIARGIKEVLIDTIAGLVVAVYATIFYKLFELWSRRLSIDFEERVYLIIRSRDATTPTQSH